MGLLDFFTGPLYKNLNEPVKDQKKKEAPAEPKIPKAVTRAKPEVTPEDLNKLIQVVNPPRPPEPAPLEIGPIAAGNQGPPMSLDDVLKVLAGLGGGQKGVGDLPPVPEFHPTPTNVGEIPIDLRPIAGWLDSNYGTKYAQSTVNAPENYLQMAAKYKELSSGGQAVEQARAMAELERYKAQLKALHGSGLDDKLLKVITGGRGITFGAGPSEAPAATASGAVPPSAGPTQATSSTGTAPLALPAAQALAQAKARKDIKDQSAQARYEFEKSIQGAGVATAKEAMNDKLIRRYTDNIIPATTTLRNALLSDKTPGGEATILALQAFQQSIEPALAVHQSDIQNYKDAQGLVGKAQGFIDTLRGGSPLSPKAREDMLKMGADMENIWRQAAVKKLDTYKRIGGMQGVKPEVLDQAVGNELKTKFIHIQVTNPKTKEVETFRLPNDGSTLDRFRNKYKSMGWQIQDVKGSH
jgi:hypothetical protein